MSRSMPRARFSLFILEGWPDPARFAHCLGEVLTRARAASQTTHSPVLRVRKKWSRCCGQRESPKPRFSSKNCGMTSRGPTRFHLRCAYSVGAFGGAEHEVPFLRMCAEHSRVFPIDTPVSESGPETGREERSREGAVWQQRASLEVEIASRKKLRQALQYRESELVDLLENGVEGMQRTGPDQKIIWANRDSPEAFGISGGGIRGPLLRRFLRGCGDSQ